MKTGMRVAVSQHRLFRRSRDVPLHGLLTDLLVQVGDLPEQVVRSRRSVRQWSADPARQLRVVELIDLGRWWGGIPARADVGQRGARAFSPHAAVAPQDRR